MVRSVMDETEHNNSDAPTIKLSPLRERASKTAKGLWTAVGALATLGGVVGLIQVFSTGSSASLGKSVSSQDVLMEMVSRGDIDVDDAERLAEILFGQDSGADSEGLQDIVEGGSDRQKEALALLAERHTREEGLTILEAEAETGADWRLVAEFAYGFDPKRGLSAVKKAIALDPEDFRAVTLMSQIQVQTGDFASAQRSAKTAELLATTPSERVMASRSSLNILISGTNITDMPAGVKSLEKALEPYTQVVETTPLPPRFKTIQEAEIHPVYLRAASRQGIATANLYLADFPATKENSELAIEDFRTLLSRVPSEDAARIKSRIASIYDNPIFVEYNAKNWPELMSVAREQLDLYREIAEAGDKRGQSALPGKYAQYAGYAVFAGEIDTVRSASRRSVELARLAADRRPDDVRLALNVGQFELNSALLLASVGEKVDLSTSFDKTLTSLEDSLRGKVDEAKNSPWTRYSGLLAGAVNFFNQDDLNFDENLSDDILSRAENFLDQEIASRPEAHDPRHARNSVYLLMGDNLSARKDVDGARQAYRRAYDDSADITPTETEPDVVLLSELVALQRLVALEEEGVEATDRPELNQAIELAQRLDREGKLTTPYQPVLSFLIATRDGTIPDYEAAAK